MIIIVGIGGVPGQIGERGDQGEKGIKGSKDRSIGYYYTRHSQNINDPICPNNSTLMWSGYSLLYIMGDEK